MSEQFNYVESSRIPSEISYFFYVSRPVPRSTVFHCNQLMIPFASLPCSDECIRVCKRKFGTIEAQLQGMGNIQISQAYDHVRCLAFVSLQQISLMWKITTLHLSPSPLFHPKHENRNPERIFLSQIQKLSACLAAHSKRMKMLHDKFQADFKQQLDEYESTFARMDDAKVDMKEAIDKTSKWSRFGRLLAGSTRWFLMCKASFFFLSPKFCINFGVIQGMNRLQKLLTRSCSSKLKKAPLRSYNRQRKSCRPSTR